MANPSLFWARWMRNTMTKAVTFVIVLMISCHVSEYLKNGPAAAHAITTAREEAKAPVLYWRSAAEAPAGRRSPIPHRQRAAAIRLTVRAAAPRRRPPRQQPSAAPSLQEIGEM